MNKLQDSRLDFLIIGTQKGATTWLHQCLLEHPQLHLPKHKREIYYLGGDLHAEHGDDWYFSMLSGASSDQLVGDTSVDYLCDSRSPQEIYRINPNTKFIISLREPIDRAISAYYWLLRKNKIGVEGLDATLMNMAQEMCPISEPQHYLENIIARGMYGEQIAEYLQYFPASQFLIVSFDDIKTVPNKVLETIFNFLQVNPGFQGASQKTDSFKKNVHIPALLMAQRYLSGSKLFNRLFEVLNSLIAKANLQQRKPVLQSATQQQLVALYRPAVQQLDSVLDVIPDRHRLGSRKFAEQWYGNVTR